MNVRTILASTAAAAMIAGVVTIASAPAASAATIDRTALACPTSSNVPLEASQGDTITIDVSGSGCTSAFTDPYPTPPDENWALWFSVRPDGAVTDSATWVLRADAPLGTDVALCVNNGSGAQCWVLTIVAGPDPVPGAESSPIPEWLQAYGRSSANEACLEGWTASWAEWMNDGTGGFVCERSIPSLG